MHLVLGVQQRFTRTARTPQPQALAWGQTIDDVAAERPAPASSSFSCSGGRRSHVHAPATLLAAARWTAEVVPPTSASTCSPPFSISSTSSSSSISSSTSTNTSSPHAPLPQPPLPLAGLLLPGSLPAWLRLHMARNLKEEPEPFEAEFDEEDWEGGEFEVRRGVRGACVRCVQCLRGGLVDCR